MKYLQVNLMTEELFYGTTDAQGRITIPKRIRERLKIVPGTIVILRIRRETEHLYLETAPKEEKT